MRGITHIKPAISFRRVEGGIVALAHTDAVAEWLDRTYDAILDPRRNEGASSWPARSLQLLEIEKVLFGLAAESSSSSERISAKLRSKCEAIVAKYRNLVPAVLKAGTTFDRALLSGYGKL
ncbi:MAG: hypothetical protein ACRC67_28435 [Inquilinus sp.]|uniref:hypothetical protein n=1 Tax=Inquilinus sp. TaxID=1932117 RepID=UPI003F307A35